MYLGYFDLKCSFASHYVVVLQESFSKQIRKLRYNWNKIETEYHNKRPPHKKKKEGNLHIRRRNEEGNLAGELKIYKYQHKHLQVEQEHVIQEQERLFALSLLP